MSLLRNNKTIIGLLAALLVIYSLFTFFISTGTNIYNITPNTNNDRFFSMDDVYYATSIYSTTMENTDRIVKHPLFMVWGNLFTRAERAVFGEISRHYMLIISFQILILLVSVYFLFAALVKIHGQTNRQALFLCLVYALSFSTVTYTLLVESFIFSSCFLIMSYYFIRRKNLPMTIILGVLVTGVTVTNCIIWAIMLFLSNFSLPRKIIASISSAAAFLALVAVFPVRNVFFTRIFTAGFGSYQNYGDHYSIPDALRRTFFAIFCTPFMQADTVNNSPFGAYAGRAISFEASAPLFTLIVSILWLAALMLSCKGGFKSPDLYIPLAVLIFNILFHGILQYGLKEAFLYSLHHLFAQILIFSNLIGTSSRGRGSDYRFLPAAAMLLLMTVSNLMTFPDLWAYAVSL